ncbi:MAG: L-threonylcarbamoyladenylate synthase [Bacteroidota bacterium]|nr:L-threonylcarbamoyladenylate synthase [Bacteroidota bacterium]
MKTIISTDIEQAKYFLDKGEVVAIPTETVYGLAGNALSDSTLLKIYKTKNRPSFDPLIVHFDSIYKTEKFVQSIPEIIKKLAERFSPGPLTYLLNKRKIISDIVTSGLPKVAIRFPNHPLTIKLLSTLDFPVAAPSANLFGKVSPTSPQHVYEQLNGKIPFILDGGKCNVGIESTIVSWEKDNLIIHRLGGVSVEDIITLYPKIKIISNKNQEPDSPGQLKSHYATKTPLFFDNVEEILLKRKSKNIGLIAFNKKHTAIKSENQCILSPEGSLDEAAKKLFHSMHELDERGFDFIIAEKFPDNGLGRAINDRLKKASVNF